MDVNPPILSTGPVDESTRKSQAYDGVNGEDKNGKQVNLTYDQIQNAKVIIEF